MKITRWARAVADLWTLRPSAARVEIAWLKAALDEAEAINDVLTDHISILRRRLQEATPDPLPVPDPLPAPINLADYRPHRTGFAICTACGHRHVAVVPATFVGMHECPGCGKMAVTWEN